MFSDKFFGNISVIRVETSSFIVEILYPVQSVGKISNKQPWDHFCDTNNIIIVVNRILLAITILTEDL